VYFSGVIRLSTKVARRSPAPEHRNGARCWFGVLSLLLSLVGSGPTLAEINIPDPARETRAIVAQAVAILHNTSINPEHRRRELVELAEGKLDFAQMARVPSARTGVN
jgi:hypothetical protein